MQVDHNQNYILLLGARHGERFTEFPNSIIIRYKFRKVDAHLQTVRYMQIEDIVKEFGGQRILIIGDIMLDRYVRGDVERISPEAPVPVLKVTEEFCSPGGAANVAVNLRALGAKVTLIGASGKDADGDTLGEEIKQWGIGAGGVVRDPQICTTVKTRLIAANQQIARIDKENGTAISDKAETALIRKIEKSVTGSKPSAIIISDYAKGTLTNKVLSYTLKLAHKKGVFTVVDPKGEDYAKYRGADALTPNIHEAEAASGIRITDDRSLSSSAKRLFRLTDAWCILITRGREGITYCKKGGRPVTVLSRAKEVFDVTGAGDTVVSVFTLAYLVSGSLGDSVRVANAAAGITVGRLGASHVTCGELIEHFANPEGAGSKIHSGESLSQKLAAHRSKGQKIVFTNGCFDLFHTGHLKLLREAAREGDILVVAINSDKSVKKLKGQGRPFVSETDRANLITALDCVSYLTVFEEDTPLELIKKLRPDVIVKGGDYRAKDVVGRTIVESYGGRVTIIPLHRGVSTSSLAGKIKKT